MNSADIAAKYQKTYFMPPEVTYDWVKKDSITKPPIWCSVDLRDGNQALIDPMSLEDKLEFFKMLVKIGFKEIEVGFPASSDTEYNFIRALIERDMIPEDVTIQVLTQAREHIIRKTFEALKGAKHAVVHVYNSTSLAQREQVFGKSREEILQIAVDGAKLLKDLTAENGGNYQFEYSPESFTGTELDFALDIWCRRLGILVLFVGFFYGIRCGHHINEMEHLVYQLSDTLLIWTNSLLWGSALLGISKIIQLLEK